MIHSIDHIVILVDDLKQTIVDYTALGFTVVPGGEHPGGATHNALVAFDDGAYLELIAFKQPAEQHRWWRLGQRGGEGLVDYALLPSDTGQVVAAAAERGLELEGPHPGGRVRPDGERLEWQTARAATSDLPFLCGDITPRRLRVPEGPARQHANGAIGVAAITIAISDAARSVERYRALLGGSAALTLAAVVAGLGLRVGGVGIGSAVITLAAPGSSSGPARLALGDHLAERGEGPYAVAFAVEPGATTGPLDQRLAHGARLELVAL